MIDYSNLLVQFRGNDSAKQINALCSAIWHDSLPTEAFLNEIIENGLCNEKSQKIRELSFELIRKIYEIQIVRWTDVRSALMTELGTCEGPGCFVSAAKILYQLPTNELILFIGSKDGASLIKSCCLAEISDLRVVAVETLGPLLLEAWIYLEASVSSVEGLFKVESTSESRRFRDDIFDLVIDLFKNFARGAKGVANSSEAGQLLDDSCRACSAYTFVLGKLFELYNLKGNTILQWTSAILGTSIDYRDIISASSSRPLWFPDLSLLSACLAPLVKHVLPILVCDPFVLMARWRDMRAGPSFTSCITEMVVALLNALPSAGAITSSQTCLELPDAGLMQFASMSAADDFSASRSKVCELNVQQLAEDWVLRCLHPLLCTSLSADLLLTTCRGILAVTQHHSSMAFARNQVYPTLLQQLTRHLLTCTSVAACTYSSDSPVQNLDEVMAWMLLVARHVDRDVLQEHLPTVVSLLETFVKDPIAATKLYAESASLMLLDASQAHRPAPPLVLQSVLAHPTVQKIFSDISPTLAVGSSRSYARERILVSVCVGIVKIVPVCLSYLESAVQSPQVATTPSASADGDSSLLPRYFEKVAPPFGGVGFGSELFGATVKSTFELSAESQAEMFPQFSSKSEAAALAALDNIVSSALLVIRASSRCLSWSVDDLAGESPQLAFVQLIGCLAEILTPIESSSGASDPTRHAIKLSLDWANAAFADVVNILLGALREEIQSSSARAQLLRLLAQYLASIFGHTSYVTVEKGLEVLSLIRYDILLVKAAQTYDSALNSQTSLGALGGWLNTHPPHAFNYAPVQMQSLVTLELMAHHNPRLATEVLEVLREFKQLCAVDAERAYHIVCPSIQGRLELATRRVQLCCPEGFILSSYGDVGGGASGGEAEGADRDRYRTQRSKSIEFSTYDSNMTGIFTTAIAGRSKAISDTGASPNRVGKADADEAAETLSKLTFELMVKPEFSEPLDAGLEYSIFSAGSIGVATMPAKSPGEGRALFAVDAKHVCSADVVALVDDVWDYHLTPLEASPSMCASRQGLPPVLAGRRLVEARAAKLTEEPQWTTLSGSSDIFTVQAYLEQNPFSYSVRLVVRVVNSSGFKIPGFNLKVNLRDGVDMECNASAQRGLEMGASGGSAVDGTEYFLPGAYVDRQFDFSVLKLCSYFLVVRVIYLDVNFDADFTDLFSIRAPSDKQESAAQAQDELEDAAKGSRAVAASEESRSVQVDCSPLLLPCTSMLLPYGLGSLGSLVHSINGGCDGVGGIPKSVFQSLWSRTPHGFVAAVASDVTRVDDVSTCHFANIGDVVTAAVVLRQTSGVRGDLCGAIGMDARVRLGPRDVSLRARDLSSALAWCLHDWWGHEVGVHVRLSRLSMSSGHNQSYCWSGEVEVRSSCQWVLKVLEQNLHVLMHALTSGVLSVSSSLKSINFDEQLEKRSGRKAVCLAVPTALELSNVYGSTLLSQSKPSAVRNIKSSNKEIKSGLIYSSIYADNSKPTLSFI